MEFDFAYYRFSARKHPVLGLKELNDDQLMAMNPSRRDHQHKAR